MLQRFRQNPQPVSETARPSAASDPWKAAGESRGSDQGVWILSYLDVMMILFAFFVLLFAYQKAMAPSAVRPQKAVLSGAETRQPVRAVAKVPPSGGAVARPAEQPSATVSAMLSQAPLNRFSRQAAKEVRDEPVPVASPAPTKDTVAVAVRLASAQTGQWISQALQKETQGRQVEVLSAGRGVRLEMSEAILFDPASAELKQGGEALLDRVLPVLLQQPGIVFVEGHTDSTPIANSRFPSNWELSTARATAVTRYLIGKGIGSERIRAVGLADTHPRAANGDAEGRARNRRVTLVLGDDQSAR